jgi:hypothetical protein
VRRVAGAAAGRRRGSERLRGRWWPGARWPSSTFPVDLALGDDGTLYFTDVRNHCVRAIDPDGTISTVVGVCGEHGFEGDGGPADEALLNLAFGVEYVDGACSSRTPATT